MKILSARSLGSMKRLCLGVALGFSLAFALMPVWGHQEPVRTAQSLGYANAWDQQPADSVFAAFNDWAARFVAAADSNTREALSAEGLTLATQRRAALAELLRSNPQRALSIAVPASARQQFPAEIQAQLENRVSGIGDVSVLCYFPSKVNPVFRPLEWTVTLNGVSYEAKAYGRRATQGSRKGISLHGIELNGVLALHESCLRELEPGETPAASLPLVDLSNGAPAPDSRMAEMGGKIYRFASLEKLWEAERNLEANEAPRQPVPLKTPHSVLENPSQPPGEGGAGENPTTPWNTGLKNVLVIRVDFSDIPGDPDSFGIVSTAPYCQTLMDTDVTQFYERSSYGQTTLSNTVTTQLYRMPQSADFYATSGANQQLHTDAQTLAAVDYNVQSYDRIVVVFAFLGNLPGSQINYGGLANIIGPQVWVNGEFDFRIMSHELGHTYGLFHTSLWEVNDANPISPNGTSIEYGDNFDTMGSNFADDRACDFNPYFKNLLGWLRDDQVQTVNVDGIYRIHTFDWGNDVAAPTNATLALRFVKDSERTYWVGIRRNFGQNQYMQNGAYVMWGLNTVGAGGGGGYQSALLDINTPGGSPQAGTASDFDAALSLGSTFVDSAVNFKITPLTKGGSLPNEYLDVLVGDPGPVFGLNLVLVTNYISAGNANGVVDTNECNNLDLVIANGGSTDVTGIEATLTTTTTGVIVAQRSSTYTNLPPGAIATNQPSFRISTAPTFICGTPLDFTLVIKADQGSVTNRFSLASGIPATPLRYDNFNVYSIPDSNRAGTNSPVVVSNFNTAVAKVAVALHLTHTFDADLRLELISPEGITNILAANQGGSGDNYGLGCQDNFRTIFDDDVTNSVTTGLAPFFGTFQPEEPLAVFVGKSGTNVNGIWRLRVVDEAAIDIGAIQCWSLYLSPASCLDGGGQCPGVDLAVGMTAAPNPVFITSNLVYTISVTNFGPNIAKNVVVSQNLPNNVVIVSTSSSQGTVSQSGGIISASIGTLNPTAKATVTVVVLPTQQTSRPASSTATVVTSDTDVNPSNNSITIATQVNDPLTDLSVGMVGAPNPVLSGAALTYTVSVTNGGPSLATGVVVTNTLPGTVGYASAFASKGSFLPLGDKVLWTVGTLTNGERATLTINVVPTAEGTITASARVSGPLDPLPGNNLAIVNIIVGPAADLVVGLVASPTTAVVNSNVTYTVTVTNRGPSIATGVVLNETLPVGVTLVSSNSTQGSFTLSGSTLSCSVGTLSKDAGALITLILNPTNVGTIHTTASTSGSQPDPIPGNNSASSSVFVAAPFVSVVGAGATLTGESQLPANGAIDPAEAVTIELRLRNAGNVVNTNLVATLLPTGGVTSPSAPETYGELPAGGLPKGRQFSFTATGTNGDIVVVTLQLQDGPNSLGTVSFNFVLPSLATFANTNVITIPEVGAASPYPSTITVSGLSNLIGKVTATLVDFNHTYPHDVSVLLVGPAGQKVVLMSHASDAGGLANGMLTFDSGAPTAVPVSGQLVSGTFQPAEYAPASEFPANAPARPYDNSLSVFNGPNPNGTWSLYVTDDSPGDFGNVAQGWRLGFTSVVPINQVADIRISGVSSPAGALVGQNITNVFTITNAGPNAASSVAFTNQLPSGLQLIAATASQGNNLSTPGSLAYNLGAITVGGSATVTVVATVHAAGMITNLASVYVNETDLNLANNLALLVSNRRLPFADLALFGSVAPEPVVIGNNLTYTVTLTNLGPETALNVAVTITNPLPPGFSFVTPTNLEGNVVISLGQLAPNATASVTVVGSGQIAGILTNTIVASTASFDTNAANDAITLLTTVQIPAPRIEPAGALLVKEGFEPPNGSVDDGETVTVLLALTNSGSAEAVNLTATLVESGGVTNSSGSESFGLLTPGGPPGSRQFEFTADVVGGGAVTATLALLDGTNDLGTASFTFNLPRTVAFTNSQTITIPEVGSALQYPSSIAVSGLTGLVTKVTATLNEINHRFPHDVNVMLVSPAGESVVLMSHAGGGQSLTNVTVSFDDASAVVLPTASRINAGVFKPTAYLPATVFPPPAATAPHSASLAALGGIDPNGIWSLYVVDDSTGDGGNILNGWSLSLTLINPVDRLAPVADLALEITDEPDPVYVGGGLVYHITVTNRGPAAASGVSVSNSLPVGLNYVSGGASQGSVSAVGSVVTASLGGLGSGSSAVITVRTAPTVGGIYTNTVVITGSDADLNLVNNSASAISLVLAPQSARFSEVVLTNGELQATLIGEPGFDYVVLASVDFLNWTPVATNQIAPNGSAKFADPNAVSFGHRFYRAERQIP